MADSKIYRIPDGVWEKVELLLPPELPKPRGGRPRMDSRKAMEAILYLLRTGCTWKDIPRSMGAGNTVRRHFQEWQKAGVFQRLWRAGILTYDEMRTLVWYGDPEMQPSARKQTRRRCGGHENQRNDRQHKK